ncbi:polysaccharide biosynthesis tyrosine autokinase [Mycolicibacterium neoaurum]|uniref:polysaccharide biosynthesis tyrosine autokinase n=1 Tax=Mycolicibacterium neoaurum TaxID=1795 RepID=UPI001BCF1437|nr:polysaccharide biosynthesis tyrosine autokinase [Mycolicibacterium neoaurum]QVI27574.1 polysaccharide biosynthesis tyrosine autokinase [Mycolicibacterium neoaurum]
MSLNDFVKTLRSRWSTIVVTLLVSLIAAVTITVLTTPIYQASTRLFVSTAAGSSLAETYQGNRFSQERVASYSQLLVGRTLAERTIDKLGLEIAATDLQARIAASAEPDTVLISVYVKDESPVRARDIANTLSDEFVIMVRELETPQDGSPPDSRVVVEERAAIPDSPIEPKPMRNVASGLLLGAILGVGLAVARDILDNTVKDRETIEQITGHGHVGSIPLDKERRKQVAISFDSDHSAIAEAFRKLRTNLQFLSVDDPPRVIVVTSSLPSEGKSTTAINLALALAEADHNVVLVDGDLRRPSLHKYLSLIAPVGFSTVLSGTASLSEALQKTKYPNLTVLTSGSTPPNPSELLASQAARTLLTELRGEFDYVIVDTTPMLAVTDAAILAAGADGVLLMAKYGKTKREQLASSARSLADVGARTLGAVLTIVPTRGTRYSYNYNYDGRPTDQSHQPEKGSEKPKHGDKLKAAMPTIPASAQSSETGTLGQ